MSESKKKVLLLNPPGKGVYLRDYYCSHASKAHYYWGPYDLIVLSGILKDHYALFALDAMDKRLSPKETLERIRDIKPDAIIFLTGAVSFIEDFELMQGVSEAFSGKIEIIGTGDCLLSEAPKFFDAYPFLDAAIMNFISDDIVYYLEGERRPFHNVSFRRKDAILELGDRILPEGEFSLPIPHYDIFPFKNYRIPHGLRLPYAGILTDYGCPFHCDYCIGGELGFHLRNMDNLFEELRELKRRGVRELWIKDLTFGVHKKRSFALLQRMRKENLNFTWACLSRVNVLDAELLEEMKAAGCHTIQMGVESASEEILQNYTKGITLEQARKIASLCKKTGVRILAHYILGLPGDTVESVRKTIQLAIELNTEFASFNIAMPRMGTVFRRNAIEKGLISDDLATLDNSISQPVYETAELSREKLWELRNEAIRRYHLRPSFILRRLFGVRTWYEFTTLFREGFSLIATTIKKE
ncbi:radical SAM protein [Candidatus Sumerlaeota bacterium]|nr:radical SAM protein [Candidatus Sumerlaeota bacterium]